MSSRCLALIPTFPVIIALPLSISRVAATDEAIGGVAQPGLVHAVGVLPAVIVGVALVIGALVIVIAANLEIPKKSIKISLLPFPVEALPIAK